MWWLPLLRFQRAELEPPSLIAMRKLSKRDVEALLAGYDKNPVSSLLSALQLLLPEHPSNWEEAVNALSTDDVTKQQLRDHSIDALDSLVKQLVETRSL